MGSTHRNDLLMKAEDRGYLVTMQSGDYTWYSMYNERHRLNLQLWIDSEQFELSHMKGAILITTTKCGSFMNDKHFERIEREIRKIVFDLL